MDRLPTRVNRSDADYQNRRKHNQELVEVLRQRLDNVSNGGGESTSKDIEAVASCC